MGIHISGHLSLSVTSPSTHARALESHQQPAQDSVSAWMQDTNLDNSSWHSLLCTGSGLATPAVQLHATSVMPIISSHCSVPCKEISETPQESTLIARAPAAASEPVVGPGPWCLPRLPKCVSATIPCHYIGPHSGPHIWMCAHHQLCPPLRPALVPCYWSQRHCWRP